MNSSVKLKVRIKLERLMQLATNVYAMSDIGAAWNQYDVLAIDRINELLKRLDEGTISPVDLVRANAWYNHYFDRYARLKRLRKA